MKIAIDAGHNPPWDYGVMVNAIGDYTYDKKLISKYTTIEYFWNRRVAAELQYILTNRGHLIFPFCGSLVERVKKINNLDVEMAIEIHHDAHDDKNMSGASVLYYPASDKGKSLAKLISDSIKTSYKCKGIFEGYRRLDKRQPILYFIRRTRMVALLIECAYLTNISDKHMMTQDFYIYTMARRIAEGIEKYCEKET